MDSSLAKSFSLYIQKEDAYDLTPAGALLKQYLELFPDLKFIWINNIKCVESLDSAESIAWAEYLVNQANKIQHIPGIASLGSLNLNEMDITSGHHLVIANWYYNNCLYLKKASRSVPLRSLTNFETLFRERVLQKLNGHVGNFFLDEDECDAICSFFFVRRNDKFQKIFIPNKVLALRAIKRFATINEIRFEDAENLLRSYTYII